MTVPVGDTFIGHVVVLRCLTTGGLVIVVNSYKFYPHILISLLLFRELFFKTVQQLKIIMINSQIRIPTAKTFPSRDCREIGRPVG